MWWFKHELQFITTDPPWIHSSSDMHAYDVCQIFIENEFITVSFHRSSFHATLPLEMLPLSRDTSRTTFRRCSSICFLLELTPLFPTSRFWRTTGNPVDITSLINHRVSRTWILWKNMQSTQSNGAFDWVQKHHNFQNSRKFPKISENSWNKVFKPMLMEDSLPVSSSHVPTFLWRRWAPQTHRLRWSHLNCLAWCTPGN